MNRLPAHVVDADLRSAVESFKLVTSAEIQEHLTKVTRAANKVETQIYPADDKSAKSVKAVTNEIKNATKAVEGFEALLTPVNAECDPKEFIKQPRTLVTLVV